MCWTSASSSFVIKHLRICHCSLGQDQIAVEEQMNWVFSAKASQHWIPLLPPMTQSAWVEPLDEHYMPHFTVSTERQPATPGKLEGDHHKVVESAESSVNAQYRCRETVLDNHKLRYSNAGMCFKGARQNQLKNQRLCRRLFSRFDSAHLQGLSTFCTGAHNTNESLSTFPSKQSHHFSFL